MERSLGRWPQGLLRIGYVITKKQCHVLEFVEGHDADTSLRLESMF